MTTMIYKAVPMKIAILADIHSNLAALETVLDHIDCWRPDQILVAGDIINRGPQPRACLELILARAERECWPVIKGNHEDYVLSYLKGDWPTSGPTYEIQLHARWTFGKLDGLIDSLAAMPDEWASPDEQIRMVHASMLGNRNGIFPWSTNEELRKKIAPAPAVFLAGHTHRPLVRTVEDTLIVNVGSVGQPFDRDHRAAYAQLTVMNGCWTADIIRLEYDRALTERLFHESGYLGESGDFARLKLAEFREARSLIPGWYDAYEALVTTGEMPMKESIDRYLREQEIEDV
jgi:predicted phosphodiesterase